MKKTNEATVENPDLAYRDCLQLHKKVRPLLRIKTKPMLPFPQRLPPDETR
jgi:hypothetical protein